MVKDNGNPTRALRSINDTLLMYRFLYPPKKKKIELLNLLFLFKFDWPTYFFRWLHVVFDGGIYRHPKSRAKFASIFSLLVVRFVWFVPWLSVSNLLETSPMDPVRNNFYFKIIWNTNKAVLLLHCKLGKWSNCVCVSMSIGFDLAMNLWSHELFRHGQWFRLHLPIHRQLISLFHHFRI